MKIKELLIAKENPENKIISVSFLNEDNPSENGIYPTLVKRKTVVAHRHPIIAALITGACRVQITALAERYHKHAIYCDTDSFITQVKVDKKLIDNDKIGMLKIEHENVDIRFFGRKQYQIIGKEIKQKGVKIKDEKTFIEQISTDTGYQAYYKSPTGIKGAAKKDKANPNKFEDLYRTVRADKSSKEKGLLKC